MFVLKGDGLNFNGYSFDDENYQTGNKAPQNACLLALYGNKASFTMYPNARSYAVSGGPAMKHFNSCCCEHCTEQLKSKKCMKSELAPSGFDFMNFMVGDGCTNTADTDGSYKELHCFFDSTITATTSAPSSAQTASLTTPGTLLCLERHHYWGCLWALIPLPSGVTPPHPPLHAPAEALAETSFHSSRFSTGQLSWTACGHTTL